MRANLVFSPLLLAEPTGKFLLGLLEAFALGIGLNETRGQFVNPLLRIGRIAVALAQQDTLLRGRPLHSEPLQRRG